MGPKSILKNKGVGPSDEEAKTKEQRKRDTALHHATLIQHQKDVESQIFESLLQLIELPSSESADPAKPTPEDIESLRKNLTLFQQNDFDALIEERRANGKCGYALCPRPHRKDSKMGKFRIVGQRGASEMKIVPRETFENWCSDACAKRAMYVKVQLSDEPAWIRAPSSTLDLQVMDGDGSQNATHKLPLRLKPGSVDEAVQQGMADLRLERGDTETSSRPGTVLSSEVHEKESVKPPNQPRTEDSDVHALVEGYRPKARFRKGKGEDDEDDEGDQDWGL